ncbi:DUF2975 domain-containing protein [Cellulomonas fengjieae]|uniref:DUF2975 domain-containing protein n=1 Tax=Cellulomonas fengjieae TaxID=2819978 RepID=A0ABS3SMS2_9CELL|nr:DUF2975 domain-containing protein [Cellulomonas fengjieae]MBO3086256.1 DUF2975 domain-containing protein [Cellulomonas fengjieae]QVI65698.1 DUF2975 domain-containing protein [Cellulomonas fengjieae]
MGRLAILALRAVIVLMFAGLLVVQGLIIPALGRDIDDGGAEVAYLRWPVVITMFLGVLAVQVVLVCVWQLLTMVRRDTVFSRAAFRYVDVIIGAAVAMTVLAMILSFVLAPGEVIAPGIVLLVVIGGTGTAGIALLVLVLRFLLAKATTLRAELDEVI